LKTLCRQGRADRFLIRSASFTPVDPVSRFEFWQGVHGMKHKTVWALFVLSFAVFTLTAPLGAQGDKVPEVKEIMAKLNKPTGTYFELVKELKDQATMWDEARLMSKTLAQQSAFLAKNPPPKGEKASWDTLTKVYIDNAKAVDAAVQKMDKRAAQAALMKMGGEACTACHKAHRGN
jgi:hypothetical protein